MTAKQYLEQIRNYEWRIGRINEEIERLESIATNTSPTLTGMPHNPSPTTSRMADAVCAIIDKQTELREELTKLDTLRKEAAAMIAQLERPDERDVLYKRYMESKTWEDIICEMRYERSWVYRIHKKALNNLQKHVDEKEAT